MSLASVIECAEELSREPAPLPTGPRLVRYEREHTRDEVRQAEIACELLALSGGGHFDAVVNAMWLGMELLRARKRVYRALPDTKRLASEGESRRYEKLRSVKVETRACKYCGKEFTVDAWRVKFDKAKACSRECPKKPQNVGQLYTMGGRTMSVPAWAAEAGVPCLRVYRRLAKGLPLERALAKERFPTRVAKAKP